MNTQQPQRKTGVDVNTWILIAIFVCVAATSLYIFMSTKNDSSSAPAVAQTTTSTTAYAGDATNKYDDFMQYTRENFGQAEQMNNVDLIEYGDLVCGSLDSGYSIATVVDTVSRESQSSANIEFGAVVIYSAISYLCPEYTQALNAYLESDSTN